MTRKADIEYFEKHKDKLLGAITYTAKEEGPHVLIIGGTHGNEPSGVKAIIKIHQYMMEDPKFHTRGKVTFLLANPAAYLEDKRYIEFDLNRSFTETLADNFEGRRAQDIRTYFDGTTPIDRVLDLHSVSRDNSQILVYSVRQPHSQELGQAISGISTHLAFHSEHIPGLLIGECYRHGGATCLVVECGNHTDPHAESVAHYHTYRFLQYYGLVQPHPEWDAEKQFLQTADDITYYETICSIKPEGNSHFDFTRDDLETGTFFEEGYVYAKNDKHEYKAPKDCYIVMPPAEINLHDHDAGFLCTRKTIKAVPKGA